MKAGGVRALTRHVGGKPPREGGGGVARANPRQYAKRQFTWFRHQLPEFRWVKPEAAAGSLENVIPGRERNERARNLEIPRCAIAHLRSGPFGPSRNDGGGAAHGRNQHFPLAKY